MHKHLEQEHLQIYEHEIPLHKSWRSMTALCKEKNSFNDMHLFWIVLPIKVHILLRSLIFLLLKYLIRKPIPTMHFSLIEFFYYSWPLKKLSYLILNIPSLVPYKISTTSKLLLKHITNEKLLGKKD